MKKILLVLSLLVVAMFLMGCTKSTVAGQAVMIPDKVTYTNCVDFGKSINLTFTSGITNKTNIFNDQCAGRDSLIDYYCNGVNLNSKKTTCPNGCKDGACIQKVT